MIEIKFYEQRLFKYVRSDPDDHPILLTEPLFHAPGTYEQASEVLFETLDAPLSLLGGQLESSDPCRCRVR
jgi:actin-related protein